MRWFVLLLAASVLIASFPCHLRFDGVAPMKQGCFLASLNVCGAAADSSPVSPDTASIPEHVDAALIVVSAKLASETEPRPSPCILPHRNERPPEA